MTFRFHERPTSRKQSVSGQSYLLSFVAAGSSDDLFVRSYAISSTPAIVTTPQGILYRQDVELEPQGREIYYVNVPYGPKNKVAGSFTWSFDTTGGTVHVKASKSTVNRYPGNAFDHKQLIGVHGKDVDGADHVIPALKLSVTFKHPLGVITLPHVRHLARTTAMVNSDTFLGFASGEVLFLGARGSDGTDTEASVTYDFACSENAAGLTIGDIANIVKDGHDYAWISYEPDVVADKPGMKPSAVYVERLYSRTSLSAALGFGG
jgi:hypothetical protein